MEDWCSGYKQQVSSRTTDVTDVAVIKPSECGGQKFLGTGKNPGSILNLIDQLCLGLVIVILASPPKTLRPRQAGPEIMSMGSNFVLPVCIEVHEDPGLRVADVHLCEPG